MRTKPRPEDIDERMWYGVCEAASLIGMDRKTLNRKAAVGAKDGGIDSRVNATNGRREFSGAELRRYIYREPYAPWRAHQRLCGL